MRTEDISERIGEIVEHLGYEYVGTEIVKEAGIQSVRVYAASEKGVFVEDCEKISEEISPFLDDFADRFDDNYLLEVSSPGLERPLFSLADYEKFVGSPVSIKLNVSRQKRRRLSGTILAVENGSVVFDCSGEHKTIPGEDILSGHLVYIEKKGQKKTFKTKGGKKKKK